MAEPALRRMTLGEFFDWEDGSDTRYELIGGFPVAMAPPREAHGLLAARLSRHIEAALDARRPCRTVLEAGIIHPDRADTFFVADLGVTCAPYDPVRQHLQDPVLLIEILSPGTERHDRRVKLPAYLRIASVEEVLFLASDEPYAELHRRSAGGWMIELIRGNGGVLALRSVGLEIPLAALYEGFVAPDNGEA